MRKLPVLFVLLFITIFQSCKTDFEVNEDWKEIDVVYCLLDVNDTVHYVKINKAFLNKNEDAYKLAALEDSIYHKDSLDVEMQEWRNGTMILNTKLEKVYLTNKDSGIFAYPGQYLYRLPLGYQLNKDATYKLLVKNTSTGVQVSAETNLLGNANFNNPGSGTTLINFSRGSQFLTNISTGKNAKFYDMTVFINYTETDTTTNQSVKKSIRWPIYTKYLTGTLNGNEEKRYTIKNDDFYKTLMDNIPVNNKVIRKFDKIVFDIAGGGEEIYYYMNVYQPAIGVVQKKPEYTNIQNGQGIFSSRNRQSMSFAINPKTVDEVMNPKFPTSALNFRK